MSSAHRRHRRATGHWRASDVAHLFILVSARERFLMGAVALAAAVWGRRKGKAVHSDRTRGRPALPGTRRHPLLSVTSAVEDQSLLKLI